MAILDFQRPDKVIMIESTDFKGQFEFRPLEPGYGITIGNAIRRILLSSLEGFLSQQIPRWCRQSLVSSSLSSSLDCHWSNHSDVAIFSS